MSTADLYRTLEPDERIIAGDQFKMNDLGPELWAPVEAFIGHRVREFNLSPLYARVQFRRVIAREVVA